jgi:hypothetical protein
MSLCHLYPALGLDYPAPIVVRRRPRVPHHECPRHVRRERGEHLQRALGRSARSSGMRGWNGMGWMLRTAFPSGHHPIRWLVLTGPAALRRQPVRDSHRIDIRLIVFRLDFSRPWFWVRPCHRCPTRDLSPTFGSSGVEGNNDTGVGGFTLRRLRGPDAAEHSSLSSAQACLCSRWQFRRWC